MMCGDVVIILLVALITHDGISRSCYLLVIAVYVATVCIDIYISLLRDMLGYYMVLLPRFKLCL